MKANFQPGIHPDADQLSVFVEGAASSQEHERMLAHLAECAECRKAVFLMQPHEETQAPRPEAVKGWIWRLLPVALPATALACAMIALVVYLRPHGGSPEVLQQNASVRQPEIPRPPTTVAPTTDSESFARSESPNKSSAPSAAAPNFSGQTKHPANGLHLPEAKNRQIAANIASPPTALSTPSASAPVAGVAGVSGGISSGTVSDLPLNGRNVTSLQQLQTPADTKGASSQNSLATKKELPALEIEGAGGRDATLAGVSGRVTDPTGAVVAGATITLRDASGKTRQTTTGTDGSFHLTQLPAGRYDLMATATGFKTNQQSIELKPSEVAMMQPVLDVGTVSEAVTVEVTGAAPTLETESASVSRIMPVPSGLPVTTTVSLGKRSLSLDSAGNLFLSRNGGKKWKKINPRWTGKAVRIELKPPSDSGSAPKRDNEAPGSVNATDVFQLTTDANAVWTSKDGTHWHQQ